MYLESDEKKCEEKCEDNRPSLPYFPAYLNGLSGLEELVFTQYVPNFTLF